MSIQSEVTRIIDARDDAFDAVEAMGVTVASGSKIDDLGKYIMDIDTQFGDDVIFIDYDGTELYKYKASVVQSMTELPPNPSHIGLVAQGWNWSLAQIKEQLTDVGGKVVVGQMYATESGATELDIVLQDCLLHPYLRFCLNGTVTVDWGDGNQTTWSDSSLTSSTKRDHQYASGGAYTIRITVDSGNATLYQPKTGYGIFNSNSNVYDDNRAYASSIKAVRVGNNMEVGSDSFHGCYFLETITIPSSITTINSSTFEECFYLKSVVVPINANSIGQYAFNGCRNIKYCSIPFVMGTLGERVFYNSYNLRYFTWPKALTTCDQSIFYACYRLRELLIPNVITEIPANLIRLCKKIHYINIPDSVTEINGSAFQDCMTLETVVLPDSITNISGGVFWNCVCLKNIDLPEGLTIIENGTFRQCFCLSSITIPSTVTSMGENIFYNCYVLSAVHLLPTTPPTLSNTNAFTGTNNIFYVPYSSDHSILEAYKTATNWSNFADRIQEEPQ